MKKMISLAILPAVLSACIVVPPRPAHYGRGYAPRAVVVPAPVVVQPGPRYRGGW